MSRDKKILTLIAAGTLTLGGVAFAENHSSTDTTQAQDAQSQVQTTETQPEVAEELRSVENFRAALNNQQAELEELQTMNDISTQSVKFVSVGQVAAFTEAQGAADQRAQEIDLQTLISQNQQQIDELHQALMDNQMLQQVLDERDIDLEDVVAVNLMNELIVYYQDDDADTELDVEDDTVDEEPDTETDADDDVDTEDDIDTDTDEDDNQ